MDKEETKGRIGGGERWGEGEEGAALKKRWR